MTSRKSTWQTVNLQNSSKWFLAYSRKTSWSEINTRALLHRGIWYLRKFQLRSSGWFS